ncbi:HlyD family secretion protein [Chitinophaga sancti]|uniref:HlyD family secretion protein n=1 Tax=Chitinophaga sancti TaxID=1004 RepID=UPI002A74C561|nr:HlyD family secretion protein [Chitinophaga sancti]WPQ61754.1 HlyD family secretion protein [Chitinophaga sancti]
MDNKTGNERGFTVFNAIAAIVIIVGLAGATAYYFRSRNVTFTNDAQVQQLVSPVNARVGGFLKEIRFKEFQDIKAGDTLAIIDQTDLLIQRDLAAAGLEDALAGRSVASSSLNTIANTQTVSAANIEETKARLWNAKENYNRYKDLLALQSVTQQQFDQVKSEYESLKARYTSLESAGKGSLLSTSEARKRLQVNDAAIKRAKANLAAAEQNLKYSIILAPCDGIAGRKNINEGQLVQPGQSIVAIVDDQQKWVNANFKEKQMEYVKVGAEVEIKIDAIPDRVFHGKVESIAGATGAVFSLVPTDNSTGNFVKVQQRVPVRIAFLDNNSADLLQKIRAGMNAEVYLKRD